MAGQKRNKIGQVRTQVTLDNNLDDDLEFLAAHGIYGPNKNDVIIGILREFVRDRMKSVIMDHQEKCRIKDTLSPSSKGDGDAS